MKVAFVQTPAPWLVRQDAQVPLGILYLATVTKEWGHEVNMFRPKHKTELKEVLDSDVVCFSATTLEYQMTVDCAKYIKDRNPAIKMIIGGPHVTAIQERHPVFDSVCVGEGEFVILPVLDALQKNEARAFYKQGSPHDVNDIPIPDRSIIPGSHGGEIFSSGGAGKNENFITSRGCPFRCAFCASESMWGAKVRYRSMQNVEEELKYIKQNNPNAPLRICDDNITSDKNRLQELCNLLRLYDFKWRCSVRAESLTDKICAILYSGGCREVSPGIESGDQRVLNLLNKKTTLKKMADGCRAANHAGIKVRALFMIGTPGEHEDTPERNIEYIEKLRHDMITLSTFIPLPGTAIFNNPENYNCKILTRDFSKYNKDYYVRKNGGSAPREYEPLIQNNLLTMDKQIDNVNRMERYIEQLEVNKG